MSVPIGILGGSFDPVHNGHIRLAIEFYERLGLAEVRLLPLKVPPHRNSPIANPEHRLAMLKLATDDIAGMTVDDCELRKEEISYTIETLEMFREQNNSSSLCLLMGMDAFSTIHSWHRWQEILHLVHIAIAERPSDSVSGLDKTIEQLIKDHNTNDILELQQSSSGKIIKLVMPMLDISSTRIRTTITEKKNPHALLPRDVLDYIQANNLYTCT